MFYNKKPQQTPPAKKGGRPSKPNARTEKLSTRLSASEYLIVDAKIRQSGKDASAFIREMLLSGTVAEAPSAIVAQQIRQLNGGINNLNQLSHLAHASGILNVEPQIKELIDWFRDLKKKLTV